MQFPEDAKFQITVLYEGVDKLKKDTRMMLEGEFATEEEIRDSLRKLPKGGIVYFQVPTKQIKKGFVRELVYSIYDKGKKPIFSQRARDFAILARDAKMAEYLRSIGVSDENVATMLALK